jgi:hypothetical protein
MDGEGLKLIYDRALRSLSSIHIKKLNGWKSGLLISEGDMRCCWLVIRTWLLVSAVVVTLARLCLKVQVLSLYAKLFQNQG